MSQKGLHLQNLTDFHVPPPLNKQNPLSWPKTFSQHPRNVIYDNIQHRENIWLQFKNNFQLTVTIFISKSL